VLKSHHSTYSLDTESWYVTTESDWRILMCNPCFKPERDVSITCVPSKYGPFERPEFKFRSLDLHTMAHEPDAERDLEAMVVKAEHMESDLVCH